jgi:hypothetical protein
MAGASSSRWYTCRAIRQMETLLRWSSKHRSHPIHSMDAPKAPHLRDLGEAVVSRLAIIEARL